MITISKENRFYLSYHCSVTYNALVQSLPASGCQSVHTLRPVPVDALGVVVVGGGGWGGL